MNIASEELFAYQKELWDMVISNKHSNSMVNIRAIESLHSLTNDIARIVDLPPLNVFKILQRYLFNSTKDRGSQFWRTSKNC